MGPAGQRLSDLVPEFGRHISDCGLIINEVVYFLLDRWGHLLENMDQPYLTQDNLRLMADAVREKGCPLSTCFGFIDGTLIQSCRPTYNQKELYNGKDRCHGLKYQSLVTPNGLVANLYGPVEGRRHDAVLFRESKLANKIENLIHYDGSPLVVYGDKAYPLCSSVITPFRGVCLSDEEKQFNLKMNSCRIAVEWAFAKLAANFSFVKYAPNQKVYLQPVAMYYKLATLLTNCHTCLYGSQVSDYFGVAPPNLEDYLL